MFSCVHLFCSNDKHNLRNISKFSELSSPKQTKTKTTLPNHLLSTNFPDNLSSKYLEKHAPTLTAFQERYPITEKMQLGG